MSEYLDNATTGQVILLAVLAFALLAIVTYGGVDD